MKNILVLHSSVDGYTKKICNVIIDTIQSNNANLHVVHTSVDEYTPEQIHAADAVVLGASIRYGKHRQCVHDFVADNKVILQEKHTAFFSVNLVARKPEKNSVTTNPYMIKFLEQTQWQPKQIQVFAGCLDYAKYGLLDKLMIKLIMWITKGPVSSNKPIEFTNWEQVTQFAKRIIQDPSTINNK